jgi:hypothetical protein
MCCSVSKMASGVSGVVSFGISILRDGHRHIVQTVRAAQIVRGERLR